MRFKEFRIGGILSFESVLVLASLPSEMFGMVKVYVVHFICQSPPKGILIRLTRVDHDLEMLRLGLF